MSGNIVVCCDGTGAKFCNVNTNVVKLFSALDLDDPALQIAYYHGGLGTLGAPGALSQIGRRWTKLLGLAFGYGLSRDVGDCYAFLMDHFEPGDRLFLFGFSRGAFTVRALAGMLHMFGLIRPGDANLIPYAAEMLKQKQSHQSFAVAADFKRTFSRECKPHFTGVWDTVSSVGWLWDPVHIPYSARNPDMAIGRHAVSIDERRCYFRQNLWSAPAEGQDIKQVWFAGVHSDVGGGYPEDESGLSKITLEWMLVEARNAGLRLKGDRVEEILGARGGGWAAPGAGAKIHNSLFDDGWVVLEPLPHLYYDMSSRPPVVSVRFPFGRRRRIPRAATIHQSVLDRVALKAGYDPSNLPGKPAHVEPWEHW